MTRPIAILLAVLLFGLVVAIAATEQNIAAHKLDMSMLIFNLAARVISAAGLLTYCGFAALHSTQHIDSPKDRSMWLIATVAGNVLGSCWYYLSAYQRFRSAGQGGLMRFGSVKDQQIGPANLAALGGSPQALAHMKQPSALLAIVCLAVGTGFLGCEFRPAGTRNASSKEALSRMHKNIQLGDSQQAVWASINSLKTDRSSVRTNAFRDTWEVGMPWELGAGDWMLFVQFGSNRMVSAVALRTSDGIYLKPKGAPEDKGNFLPSTAQ